MKKLSILLIMLFATFATYAQTLEFGPRVGVNMSKLKGGDLNEIKAGLNIGIFAKYNLTKKIGIDVAAMYSQEGTGVDNTGEIESSSIKLNYINVPVVLKYKLIGELNIFAGPQFGFLTSGKFKVPKIATLNVKDEFKKSNISGVAGVGYTLFKFIDLNLNYNFMFNNITKTSEALDLNGSDFEMPDLKGGTFQVTVGLKF